MKHKKGILFFFFLLFVASTNAQQIPNTNQYLANRYLLSPSFAGLAERSQLFLGYQSAWNGFEGAPKTSFITAEIPINKNVWLGGEIISDKSGIINNIYAKFSYTQHLEIGYDKKLLFGIWGSMFQNKISLDAGDLDLIGDDPVLNGQSELTGFSLNAGFSLVFNWRDAYIGVCMPYLFKNKDLYVTSDSENIIELYTQIIGHASYKYRVNYNFEIEPIIVYRYIQDYQSQLNVSLLTYYREDYWLGLTYRDIGKIAVSIGGHLTSLLTLNYTFEFPSKKYIAQPASTHEFSLGFKLPTITQKNSSRWRRGINTRSW